MQEETIASNSKEKEYSEKRDISEILLHLGEESTPHHAISPPIFQTSIFSFDSFDTYQQALHQETRNYLYTRGNNPTVNLVEMKVATLEHGESAKLVASGVAAIASAVMAFCKTGDHIIAVKDCYSWTSTLFTTYLERFKITVTFVEGTKIEEFHRAYLSNTKIIYLESPTTLTFKIQNLQEVANFAHEKQIKTIIDNTWATPLFQNPLDLGIDLVIHSASKYLGGHSDVVAGIIVGSERDIEKIFKQEFLNIGYVPDPFMAWLILRGMRTLEIRLEKHFQSTMQIVNFLVTHPKVESVHYPLHQSHPQYHLAKQQMRAGTGLFSFRLKTREINIIKQFLNQIQVFKRAVSWGGYESLIYANALAYSNKSETEIPDDRVSLIRIHVGLENPQILIQDLTEALQLI